MLELLVKRAVHPLRIPVSWCCQRGLLPSGLRSVLPWSWVTEPFTIYGENWKCRWFPTKFDGIGHEVFWSGLRKWERETAPVILHEIRKSACFVDIGANCGIYTVAGAAINDRVKIIAIEPVPQTFEALIRNVRENGFSDRVIALNVALAGTDSVANFHVSDDASMSSLEAGGYKGRPSSVIQVRCRTLDSILDELRIEPDFLKIDVEGFAHAVLAGAKKTLNKCRPRIVLEVNPGDPADEVEQALLHENYHLHLITDRGVQRRTTLAPTEAFRNWLCTPNPNADL